MGLLSERPHLRFLLRASACLAGMLLVWWIFLLDPLLGWVRASGDVALGLLPGADSGPHAIANGNDTWALRVPVPRAAAARADLQQMAAGGADSAGRRKVRSFRLEVGRGLLTLITVPLPLFLAVMLAGPGRIAWRGLAYGAAAILLAMPLSLTFAALSTTRLQFHITSSATVEFLWGSGRYLNSEVFPYMVPFLLGLGCNRDLRNQILAWSPIAPAASTPEPAPPTRRERRKRRRG